MEKIKEMSIDLETYSDVDIKKSGVYKYAESENFEILLFAVSINGDDVIVYDLACGDVLPDEILDAIVSDDVIKWAFNASFERICLSYWMKRNYPDRFCSYSIPEDTVGNYLNPASWRCTMIWSAYMGLPLSLEGVGTVLGLKDQKMKEGKDLIRYFCVPCKPTKSNGGRTRNLLYLSLFFLYIVFSITEKSSYVQISFFLSILCVFIDSAISILPRSDDKSSV